MSIARSFSSLALLLGLSLAPRAALAQNMESTAAAALGVVAATPAAAFGLVTDTAISAHLAAHGRVPLAWSISGTVSWSIAAVAWAPVVGVALDSGNYPHAMNTQWAMIGAASAGAAVTLSSLALSIYALAHPTDGARTMARVGSWLPMIAPSPNGLRLGLGGSF